MLTKHYALLLVSLLFASLLAAQSPIDLVQPTTTEYPGTGLPLGMVSAGPVYQQQKFRGIAQFQLDNRIQAIHLMAASQLPKDINELGTIAMETTRQPGYYAAELIEEKIKLEATASLRTTLTHFHFPKGKQHLMLNLYGSAKGQQGAYITFKSPTEIEGFQLIAPFPEHSHLARPLYFAGQIDKVPDEFGAWQQADSIQFFPGYQQEMVGDEIGAYFSFQDSSAFSVQVRMGFSFVSIENARKNLKTEQKNRTIDQLRAQAAYQWNNRLSNILLEGGTEQLQQDFYTLLFRLLSYPKILQDANGQYPSSDGTAVRQAGDQNRITAFSLRESYWNILPFYALVYPDICTEWLKSILNIQAENGQLPEAEAFGLVLPDANSGPTITAFVDSWNRGIRTFDIQAAHRAISAFSAKKPEVSEVENMMGAWNLKQLQQIIRTEKESQGIKTVDSLTTTYVLPLHAIQLAADSIFVEGMIELATNEQLKIRENADRSLPYFFNYVKGEEWRSQQLISQLMQNTTTAQKPADIAWRLFNMMGLYPDIPGKAQYAITKPVFDQVRIQLNPRFYTGLGFTLERKRAGEAIQSIQLNGNGYDNFFINHGLLVKGGILSIE